MSEIERSEARPSFWRASVFPRFPGGHRFEMVRKKSALASLLFVAAIIPLSCTRPADGPKPISEAPPPLLEANPSPQLVASVARIPPPEADEVKSAVERIFKGTVTVDTARDRYFLVGDFNGDLSQDLAVVVKTSPGKVAKMNEEFAAWILVDPVGVAMLASRLSKHPQIDPDNIRQQVRIDEGDVLLAVIHGFESNGWRDLQATQTYVLKNAVGERINARNKEQVREAKKVKAPHLRGDVIEQTIDGRSGFLYYNGAKYAWYDPKTFKGEPERGMIHTPPNERVKK